MNYLKMFYITDLNTWC